MFSIISRLALKPAISNQTKNLIFSKNSKIIKNFFCSQTNLKNEIENIIKKQKIVLFMKGEKNSPRCGFSNVITQILRMHGLDYDSVNVLTNEDMRQGIKDYTQWPTIPQLFIDGEFIGGCDIVMQMHQNGELVSLLKKKGIESILPDAASSEDK